MKNLTRDATQRLVQQGLLRRPERCESCGEESARIEAHHLDYSDPMKVVWLCTFCHKDAHWGRLDAASLYANQNPTEIS